MHPVSLKELIPLPAHKVNPTWETYFPLEHSVHFFFGEGGLRTEKFIILILRKAPLILDFLQRRNNQIHRDKE